MKKLHKYILKEFLNYFILSNVAFISILVLIVGLMDASKQSSDNIEFTQLLLNTFKGVPLLLELTLPFTVLLATIITFSTFSKTSEIIAMKAGGISPLKILSPVIFLGFAICLLAYFNQSYVTRWLDADLYGEFKQRITNKSYWKLYDGNLVFYKDISAANKKVSELRTFEFSPDRHFTGHTYYKALTKRRQWSVEESAHHAFNPFLTDYTTARKQSFPEDTFPPIFKKDIRNPKYTPILPLWQKLKVDQQNGLNTKPLKKIIFRKISDLSSIFVMMFLAFPLSLFSARQATVGRNILISLILGFVFWLFDQIFSSLQLLESFPVWLSAFGANILFFIGGIILFFRSGD